MKTKTNYSTRIYYFNNGDTLLISNITYVEQAENDYIRVYKNNKDIVMINTKNLNYVEVKRNG